MRLFIKAIIFGFLTELIPFLVVRYGDGNGIFLHVPGLLIAYSVMPFFQYSSGWKNLELLMILTPLCSVAFYALIWYWLLRSKDKHEKANCKTEHN